MKEYIKFFGNKTAEDFSRVVNESFDGMMKHLFVSDKNNSLYGYCRQAFEGYDWSDSMWTRDMGTLLRELTLYGETEYAAALAAQLIKRVGVNNEGYYSYPRYFLPDEFGKSGDEADGTASILIGLLLLWERIEDNKPEKNMIYDFLTDAKSPVRGILCRLRREKLISGTGEFGSGCGIEDASCNVVQNNLLSLALEKASEFYAFGGMKEMAESCTDGAEHLRKNICRYLIENGKFLWCVDKDTLKPDEKIINAEINRGTTFVNGVFTMCHDVYGADFKNIVPELYSAGEKTFYELLERPLRRKLYDKYGMYMQFDDFWKGFTGPSYGQGYAIQAAALMKEKVILGKLVEFITYHTINPNPCAKDLKRESDYWLFERYYVPEADTYGTVPEAGCGPLTIVCVTEILKAARLIAGTDHITGNIAPVLPEGWTGFEAKGFPVRKNGKFVYENIVM